MSRCFNMNTPRLVLHVGCGKMAPAWLEPTVAREDLRLVGFVDVDPAAAQQAAARFAPTAQAGVDLAHMLVELKPDIVFNCTVPSAHHAVSMHALRHGAHVLSEKPLANSMAEARELVATAAAVNRWLAVTQNYRYAAAARTIQEVLASGTIGELTTVLCDFLIGAHFGGFRDVMDHVLLHDMAIHHFDLARFFTGGQARRVFCQEWNPRGSWYRHGASAQAIFTFDRGLVFNYRGSWCAEGTPTPWNGVWRLIGTRGTLLWDGLDDIRLQVATPTDQFLSEITTSVVSVKADELSRGHASVIAEFVAALQGGSPPATRASDNLQSLNMVFGAIESATAERLVELELADN